MSLWYDKTLVVVFLICAAIWSHFTEIVLNITIILFLLLNCISIKLRVPKSFLAVVWEEETFVLHHIADMSPHLSDTTVGELEVCILLCWGWRCGVLGHDISCGRTIVLWDRPVMVGT